VTVIADLSLPLLNGMDAANMLMLTMHAYDAFVGEAFQVGGGAVCSEAVLVE